MISFLFDILLLICQEPKCARLLQFTPHILRKTVL